MSNMSRVNEPYAFCELDPEEKYWVIYFNPTFRLNGWYYYNRMQCFCDENIAKTVVELLNKNREFLEDAI